MRVNLKSELRPVAIKIRQAEQRLLPPKHRESVEHLGQTFFPLEGPREPWYGPTPMLALLEYLEQVKTELKLPQNSHFADLGSGLGNACLAAAGVFDRVTGFEMVPEVYREAESIRREFNFHEISYRLQDFMRQSWGEFNVIYFFKPFVEEDVFFQLMERFIGLPSGTLIISRQFMNTWLYQPTAFDYLPPLKNWRSPTDFPCFPLAPFYGFVKR